MSMLDAFFSKGFKGPKCKTLLKLTIPRIKLLRNRREIQLKQMRRDIAKLLETGQEATARIRVEHIVREENMMAAQEILELFCELISVRLPIIEIQKECPLDLKEAISTICFAAPRCSDLPELLQVQMLFASKYGKEFVSAATELMPDCGVNRQVIELLSVRAPSAETKLKLLKDIAEEHELDWDPAATETEFTKSHEDLLNGPNQFISGSKLPLPEEKHTESIPSAPPKAPIEEDNSDSIFDTLDLPQVPNVPLIPRTGSAEAPDMVLPPYANLLAKESDVATKSDEGNENTPYDNYSGPQVALREASVPGLSQSEPSSPQQSNVSIDSKDKQFLPFMTPPSLSSASFSVKEKPAQTIPTLSRAISDAHVDLQDVLAAARNAAESAQRAAAAARSAASLAEVRISEIMKKRSNQVAEDPPLDADHTAVLNRSTFDRGQSFADSIGASHSFEETENLDQLSPQPPSYDPYKMDREVGADLEQLMEGTPTRQFQRLTSLDEDPYLSYPNLFTSSGTNAKSEIYSEDNSPPTNKAE